MKDYSKYAFRNDAKLEVTPQYLEGIYQTLNAVLTKDGVGSVMLTAPRYEYIDGETSKPIKKLTKKNKEEAKKVFSLEKTLSSEPVQHLTELGKQVLSLMEMTNMIRVENIDAGRGELVEVLEKEAKEN